MCVNSTTGKLLQNVHITTVSLSSVPLRAEIGVGVEYFIQQVSAQFCRWLSQLRCAEVELFTIFQQRNPKPLWSSAAEAKNQMCAYLPHKRIYASQINPFSISIFGAVWLFLVPYSNRPKCGQMNLKNFMNSSNCFVWILHYQFQFDRHCCITVFSGFQLWSIRPGHIDTWDLTRNTF